MPQLDENADDAEALAQLDRLYEREGMWSELLDTIDRRVELAADAAAKAEIGFRGAKVVEEKLMDPDGSIERYAVVMGLVPVHRGAREALDHPHAQRRHPVGCRRPPRAPVPRGE